MVTVVSTVEHARNPLMCILIYIYMYIYIYIYIYVYICTVELKLALFTVCRDAGQCLAVEPFFIFGWRKLCYSLRYVSVWKKKALLPVTFISCFVFFHTSCRADFFFYYYCFHYRSHMLMIKIVLSVFTWFRMLLKYCYFIICFNHNTTFHQ